MPECASCGGHVTPDFVRVFGDADGDVHGCPACSTKAAILDGETVVPE